MSNADIPRGTYPTDDEIAQRAYEMFLERRLAKLGVSDYWRIAESELLERAASRIIGRDDLRGRKRAR